MAHNGTASMYAGPGTKPGLHSQTLISTGQADLDRLFGSGLPLGSVLLVLEDASAQHHNTLLRYFVAEGVACGQHVHWGVTSEAGKNPLQGLPQLVEPYSRIEETAAVAEKEDAGLRIAWQYRRYIKDKQNAPDQQPRKSGSAFQRKQAGGSQVVASAGPRDWCHSFDLTRPMKTPEQGCSNLERRVYSGSTAISAILAAGNSLKQRISSSEQQVSQQRTAKPIHRGLSEVAVRSRNVDEDLQQSSGAATSNLPHSQGTRPIKRLMSSMSNKDRAQGTDSADLAKSGQHMDTSSLASSGGGKEAAEQLLERDLTSALSSMNLRNTSASQQGAVSPAVHRQAQCLPQQIGASSVGRLVIQSLGTHSWGVEPGSVESAAQILRAIHHLKSIAAGSRLAIMVTVPAGLYNSSFSVRLQHLCDAVLVLEAVSDDSELVRIIPDPASCCGTLRVRKLPGQNTLAPPIPRTPLYLIRHRRRRIALEPFEVDPDAEAAMSSAGVGGVAPKPVAHLCGGPPKADNKAHDF